jgi:hypothetical protein
VGEVIYTRLKQIAAELYGINKINERLGWIFTELVGELVATDGTIYA